jgi:CheY-like chemotaxis protein
MTAVLVADNTGKELADMTKLIEARGFSVVPATNRKEAMGVIGRHEVDIAVIDLRLEDEGDVDDISGLSVAEDTDRLIPKIIVSKFPSLEDATEHLKIDIHGLPGIVDFVQKSQIKKELIPKIERAMRIRKTFVSLARTTVAYQLDKDYNDARWDARAHYRVSLILSLLFALPILAGAFVLHSDHASVSALLAIGGVLVAEITNYLLSRNLKFLYRRVERFHTELLETNRFERLLEVSFEIRDEKAREQFKIALFNDAAKLWLSKNDSGRLLDSGTERGETKR